MIIFNAASTTDLIIELGEMYHAETGVRIKTNPASSGTLARQIEQGAHPDIFISASEKWAEYVNRLDICLETSAFIENSLVLIAPVSSDTKFIEINREISLPDLFSGRLSIGDPAHVPAGQYSVEVFNYFGWMEDLSDRIQPAADVRAALLVVEMGETDYGIVYKTDALKSEKVFIAGIFPGESHSPIVYFCSLINNPTDAAADFYNFMMNSGKAEAIYQKYGFTAVRDPDK